MKLKKTLGVTGRGTLNLLAWRRSTMGLAVVGTALVAMFQLGDARNARDDWEDLLLIANRNVTYDPVRDSADFKGYGEFVAEAAVAAAMRDVLQLRVWCAVALFVLTCVAMLTLSASLFYWDKYPKSRSW